MFSLKFRRAAALCLAAALLFAIFPAPAAQADTLKATPKIAPQPSSTQTTETESTNDPVTEESCICENAPCGETMNAECPWCSRDTFDPASCPHFPQASADPTEEECICEDAPCSGAVNAECPWCNQDTFDPTKCPHFPTESDGPTAEDCKCGEACTESSVTEFCTWCASNSYTPQACGQYKAPNTTLKTSQTVASYSIDDSTPSVPTLSLPENANFTADADGIADNGNGTYTVASGTVVTLLPTPPLNTVESFEYTSGGISQSVNGNTFTMPDVDATITSASVKEKVMLYSKGCDATIWCAEAGANIYHVGGIDVALSLPSRVEAQSEDKDKILIIRNADDTRRLPLGPNNIVDIPSGFGDVYIQTVYHDCHGKIDWSMPSANTSEALYNNTSHYLNTDKETVTVNKNATANLCLNGKHIDTLVLQENATINLCDCQETGAIASIQAGPGTAIHSTEAVHAQKLYVDGRITIDNNVTAEHTYYRVYFTDDDFILDGDGLEALDTNRIYSQANLGITITATGGSSTLPPHVVVCELDGDSVPVTESTPAFTFTMPQQPVQAFGGYGYALTVTFTADPGSEEKAKYSTVSVGSTALTGAAGGLTDVIWLAEGAQVSVKSLRHGIVTSGELKGSTGTTIATYEVADELMRHTFSMPGEGCKLTVNTLALGPCSNTALTPLPEERKDNPPSQSYYYLTEDIGEMLINQPTVYLCLHGHTINTLVLTKNPTSTPHFYIYNCKDTGGIRNIYASDTTRIYGADGIAVDNLYLNPGANPIISDGTLNVDTRYLAVNFEKGPIGFDIPEEFDKTSKGWYAVENSTVTFTTTEANITDPIFFEVTDQDGNAVKVDQGETDGKKTFTFKVDQPLNIEAYVGYLLSFQFSSDYLGELTIGDTVYTRPPASAVPVSSGTDIRLLIHHGYECAPVLTRTDTNTSISPTSENPWTFQMPAANAKLVAAAQENSCAGYGREPFDGTLGEGGWYYLTGDYDKNIVIPNGYNLNLCLNGHEIKGHITVESDGQFDMEKGGKLTICDCQGTGIVSGRTDVFGYLIIEGGNYTNAIVANNGGIVGVTDTYQATEGYEPKLYFKQISMPLNLLLDASMDALAYFETDLDAWGGKLAAPEGAAAEELDRSTFYESTTSFAVKETIYLVYMMDQSGEPGAWRPEDGYSPTIFELFFSTPLFAINPAETITISGFDSAASDTLPALAFKDTEITITGFAEGTIPEITTNGVAVSYTPTADGTGYTFAMPAGDVQIEAVEAASSYTITIPAETVLTDNQSGALVGELKFTVETWQNMGGCSVDLAYSGPADPAINHSLGSQYGTIPLALRLDGQNVALDGTVFHTFTDQTDITATVTAQIPDYACVGDYSGSLIFAFDFTGSE